MNSLPDILLIIGGLVTAVIAEANIVNHRLKRKGTPVTMFAPRPMDPDPPHDCSSCRYSQQSYGALLCTHGSMARRAEANRLRRGLCGPTGVMWLAREGAHAHP